MRYKRFSDWCCQSNEPHCLDLEPYYVEQICQRMSLPAMHAIKSWPALVGYLRTQRTYAWNDGQWQMFERTAQG